MSKNHSLERKLKTQNYDLIDGPIRNQRLLQLWLKKGFETIDLYANNVEDLFVSSTKFNPTTSSNLSATSSDKIEYSFNVGVTILESLLQSIGLGNFDLGVHLNGGNAIRVSYDSSESIEITKNEIDNYFSNSDMTNKNRQLLHNANRNNIIIISGILYAQNINIELEANQNIDAAVEAKISGILNGKLDVTRNSNRTLTLTGNPNNPFPIAVKAHRIKYAFGNFKDSEVVTDQSVWF